MMKKLIVLLAMVFTLGFIGISQAGNGPYDGVWVLDSEESFLIEEYEGRMLVLYLCDYDFPDWAAFYGERNGSFVKGPWIYGWPYDGSFEIEFYSLTTARITSREPTGEIYASLIITKKPGQTKSVYEGIWYSNCRGELFFAYIAEISGKTHMFFLATGLLYLWADFADDLINGHCDYMFSPKHSPSAPCAFSLTFHTEYSASMDLRSHDGSYDSNCCQHCVLDKLIY